MEPSARTLALARRQLIARAGAGAAGLALLPGEDGRRDPRRLGADPFTLGVASGDPRPDGVVLWTRLAPEPLEPGGGMPHRRRCAVALGGRRATRPCGGSSGAARRSAAPELGPLRPRRGRRAAARPRLLLPLPRPASDEPGRPHAHRAAAGRAPRRGCGFAFALPELRATATTPPTAHLAEEDLDVVFHLGDYIYEGGRGDGGVRDVALPELLRRRGHDARATTGADPRRSTRPTPTCRPRTPRFPFVVTWDDHEIENNYAGVISENGDPVELPRSAGPPPTRRTTSTMPLRRSRCRRGPTCGSTAGCASATSPTFHVLDTRQYRTDQPCDDGEHASAARRRCDPARPMLGPAAGALAGSRASTAPTRAGTCWRSR